MKTKIRLVISLLLLTVAFTSCSKNEEDSKNYTIRFHAEGGTPTPEVQTVEAGGKAIVPTINPVKEGYTFLFWSVSTNGSAYNFNTPINADLNLYAHWQVISEAEYWQVSWELNGGTWPTTGEKHATQVVKGGTLAEPGAPVKSGHTFDGWYMETALTNKITFPFDVSTITANIVLYAKWKADNPGGGDNPPTALYIVGKEYVGGSCWRIDLATGNITKTTLTIYGEANGIAISGSDVYVCGFETSTAGNDKACYWKNGDITFLTLELKKDIAASAIAVDGNDIYVAGHEHTGNSTIPCFWKNGTRTNLSTSAQWAGVTDIFISGNNIYFSGWEELSGKKSAACYWKNNIKTSLTEGQTAAEAKAIFVSGTDVYTAGRERKPSTWTACYWKNNTITTLTNATNDASVNCITMSNGKVYSGGNEASVACYWENGRKVVLEQPTHSSYCNGIAVYGNNVYAVGRIWNENDIEVACFWNNGVRVELTDGKSSAEALAVALSWE